MYETDVPGNWPGMSPLIFSLSLRFIYGLFIIFVAYLLNCEYRSLYSIEGYDER
jgi:hypothetical protein